MLHFFVVAPFEYNLFYFRRKTRLEVNLAFLLRLDQGSVLLLEISTVRFECFLGED